MLCPQKVCGRKKWEPFWVVSLYVVVDVFSKANQVAQQLQPMVKLIRVPICGLTITNIHMIQKQAGNIPMEYQGTPTFNSRSKYVYLNFS